MSDDSTFSGFPPGELSTTPIPDLFFSHVAPAIEDVAELKVSLHLFWRHHRRRGQFPGISLVSLLGDASLRRGLKGDAEGWQRAVVRGLNRAVQRGVFLQFALEGKPCYCPNTAPNRALLAKHKLETTRAEISVEGLPARKPAPAPDAPSAIRTLYERHIGLVTPIVATELAEAEQRYPVSWLEDAFAEAAQRGKRSWRYVLAVLRGWEAGGRR